MVSQSPLRQFKQPEEKTLAVWGFSTSDCEEPQIPKTLLSTMTRLQRANEGYRLPSSPLSPVNSDANLRSHTCPALLRLSVLDRVDLEYVIRLKSRAPPPTKWHETMTFSHPLGKEVPALFRAAFGICNSDLNQPIKLSLVGGPGKEAELLRPFLLTLNSLTSAMDATGDTSLLKSIEELAQYSGMMRVFWSDPSFYHHRRQQIWLSQASDPSYVGVERRQTVDLRFPGYV